MYNAALWLNKCLVAQSLMAERSDQIDANLSIRWRLAFGAQKGLSMKRIERYLYVLAPVEWDSEMQQLLARLVPSALFFWPIIYKPIALPIRGFNSVVLGTSFHWAKKQMTWSNSMGWEVLIVLTFDPYVSSVQSLPHGTSAPPLPCLALLGTTFPTCLDHNLLTLDLSDSEHGASLRMVFDVCPFQQWVGGLLQKNNSGGFNWRGPAIKWG